MTNKKLPFMDFCSLSYWISNKLKARRGIFHFMSENEKIDQIRKKLEKLKPFLREKYGVENIGIFGSYVRGEQKKRSDLDILVEFAKDAHIGLLKYVDLQIFLSEQLRVKVDLVAKDGLKPSLRERVLDEVVYT